MNQMDVIINLENIKNCESVAALMVRSGGLICHTNIDNNYSQALLITESLGKKGVVNYALDSVYENTYSIALGLVQDALSRYARSSMNILKKTSARSNSE